MSQTINSFGWAPVGQRLLREYSTDSPQYETPPTSRFVKTCKEIKSMQSMGNLVELAVAQMQLLHAVDTFPRGGLCQGGHLKEAVRRYERLWLPLVAAHATSPGNTSAKGYSHLVPPLDIAFIWHLHRLQPALYEKDCREYRSKDGRPLTGALHVAPQQAFAFTDGSDRAGAGTAAVWRKAFPNEPFYPPAAPGSQTTGFRSQLAADLAAVAVRVPVYTHQLLRACYNQLPFLSRAVDRYAKFLLLRKHHLELQHPIPPLDVCLMWTSHMSVSGEYAQDMTELLGYVFQDMPGASASPWLERDSTGPWRFHFTDTQRAWLDEFQEPFVVPGSGYVPMDSPHPAELLISPQVLALYEEQPPATYAAAAKKEFTGGSWRAGAHALYVIWLLNPNLLKQMQYHIAQEQAAKQPAAAAAVVQPPPPPPPPAATSPAKPRKKKGGGIFACFGCGIADADEDVIDVRQQQQQQPPVQQQQHATVPAKPAKVPLLSDAELKKVAAGFNSFKNLPHCSTNLYWRQLIPRNIDSAGAGAQQQQQQQQGAEVEVFAAPAAASNGHRDTQQSDQGYVTGDYEVQFAGGQPLMW